MAIDSATSLLFAIGANTDDAEANISRFRSLFSTSLSDLSAQFQSFASDITGGGEAINASFGAIAAVAAGAAVAIGAMLFESAKKTAELGEQLLLMSQQIGLSVTELSGLKVVAETMGISFDTLTRGIAIMDRSLSPFASSGATASKALASIGVNALDANGNLRPNVDLLADIADKFSTMKDGANKTALAMSIFGRSGAEMIPILDKGGSAIRSATAAAQSMGLVFDEATAVQSVEFLESLREIKFSAEGLGVSIGTAVMPQVTRMMQGIEQFWTASRPQIASFAEGFADVLGYIGVVAKGAWDALQELGVGIAFVVVEVEHLAKATADVSSLDFSGAKDELNEMKISVSETGKMMTAAFANFATKPAEDMAKLGKAFDGMDADAQSTEHQISTLSAAFAQVTATIQAMQDQMAKPDVAARAQYERGLQQAEKQIEAYRKQAAAGKKMDESLAQYEEEYQQLRTALTQKYMLTLQQAWAQEDEKAAQRAEQKQQQFDALMSRATASANAEAKKQADAWNAILDGWQKSAAKFPETFEQQQKAVDETVSKLDAIADRSASAAMSAADKIHFEYQRQLDDINKLVAAQMKLATNDQEAAQVEVAAARARSAASQQEQTDLAKLRQQQMQTTTTQINSFAQMGLAAAGYRSAMVDALMKVIAVLEEETIAHFTSAAGAAAAENIKSAAVGKGIGIRSVWHAAEEFALGLADAAVFNFAGAAKHFAASGAFASVAASVGTAVAGLFAAGSSGSSSSSAAASSSSAASTTAASTAAASTNAGTTINLHVNGVISDDNLTAVMTKMTSLVQTGQARLGSNLNVINGALVATG